MQPVRAGYLKLPHKILAPKGNANPSVVTEDGPLKGVETSTTDQFLGIPYAVPPVGKLRWMPPQPHGKWQGVFQATQFGNFCTQPDGSGGTFGSEDCLTLNIYRSSQRKNQNKHSGLPVMVYIHGGGLVVGAGAFQDPTPLVLNGGVIVVTINYRLGFLGFFAQSALDSEGHLDGNYGFMDQQFALKWVQRNIGAFGGDPHRVTIFGESAGGQSVYSILASPTAAGLFQGAISESGSYMEFQDYFDFIVPLARGETTGTVRVPSGSSEATSVGCPSQTSQCLRGVPASTLVLVEPSNLVFPFVDGKILTQTPSAAFASGQFNRVPVISGTNHDEWRLFVALQYDFGVEPLTDAEYPAAVAARIGLPESSSFVQFLINTEYPLSNYLPPTGVVRAPLALGALGTDFYFACPARNADRLLSQYVTTYTYEFNDENAPLNFGLTLGRFPLGAYHTAEIQYLFNVFGIPASFSSDQQKLSNTMIGYWTQFATTRDPNFAGAPVWSPYNSGSDHFQSLVPPAAIVESTFDSDHKCTQSRRERQRRRQ